MTKAQQEAVRWLRERGGDGVFDLHGVVLAYGERAPVTRTTWNVLQEEGLVEFYRTEGMKRKGYGRVRLTTAGWRVDYS